MGSARSAFAWLLPALALTLVALVTLTRWGTRTTAMVVGTIGLTAVVTLEARGAVLATATAAAFQAGAIVIALAAAVALALALQSPSRIAGGPDEPPCRRPHAVRSPTARHPPSTRRRWRWCAASSASSGRGGAAGKSTLPRLQATAMPRPPGAWSSPGTSSLGTIAECTATRRSIGYPPHELTIPRDTTAFAWTTSWC